jgi:hypothetical protein
LGIRTVRVAPGISIGLRYLRVSVAVFRGPRPKARVPTRSLPQSLTIIRFAGTVLPPSHPEGAIFERCYGFPRLRFCALPEPSFEGPTREGAQGRSGNRVLRRNDGYARCPGRLSRARPEGRASRSSPIFAGVAVDPSRCLDRLSAASLSEERRGSSYSSGAVKVIFGPFPTAVLQPLDGRKPNTLMVRFGVAYDRAVFPRPPFDGLTRRHGYRAMAQTRRHSPCERSALPIGLSTDRPRRARISGFARGRECRSIRCPILP